MGASLSLSIKQNSQSIANNTSNVTVTATLSWDWGTWNNNKMYGEVTIDDTAYGFTANFNWNGASDSGSVVLFTKTLNVSHEADGTKTLTCSAYFEYHSGEYAEASASKVLTTIARVSQPSCITWPEHTQNVGEFGDKISIHMNRKNSDLTHTVRYQFGSQSGTIGTNVGTGIEWTIPLSLMNLIPNSNSGSGTIYVDTYYGSTKIGTASCGFTATVPASVKPTCSFTLEDVSGVDDLYGSPVQNLSKIKITVSSTLAYSSPINSIRITANGVTYTSSPATTGVLSKSGASRVTATVTDKRGRSGSVSYDMDVQVYSPPNISKLTVNRCNEDGTANEQGAFVKAIFSAAVSAMNNKNTATYKLRYKKSTDTTFTSVSFTELKNVYSVTNKTYVFAADDGVSYDVEVDVADRHRTYTKTTSASTAFAIMHFGAEGDSIGLLKVAEKRKGIDVGGNIYTNKFALMGAHGLFDTRETNELPEWYIGNHGRGIIWEIKKLTAIQFTSPSETYGPVQTIIPWQNTAVLPRQIAYEGKNVWTRLATSGTTWGAWQSEALRAYPVNSIYISYSHTSPAELFGGTWTRIASRFLWGISSSSTIGTTGGTQNVTLTVDQIPAHSHNAAQWTIDGSVGTTYVPNVESKTGYSYRLPTSSVGGGNSHTNMPPWIAVSIWRRTA
jgi:hypothetical protein